jgi:hypothetical protein
MPEAVGPIMNKDIGAAMSKESTKYPLPKASLPEVNRGEMIYIFGINEYYRMEPQKDITAYECFHLTKLNADMVFFNSHRAPLSNKEIVDYVEKYELKRHFQRM